MFSPPPATVQSMGLPLHVSYLFINHPDLVCGGLPFGWWANTPLTSEVCTAHVCVHTWTIKLQENIH